MFILLMLYQSKNLLRSIDFYFGIVESIRKFPTQDEFKKIIENAGFKNASYQNLTFSAATIHIGEK